MTAALSEDFTHYQWLASRDFEARTLTGQGREEEAAAYALSAEEHLRMIELGERIARAVTHPAQVDRAAAAGATWEQIAEAKEKTTDQARADYLTWAQRQRELHRIYPGMGLDEDGFAAALTRLDTDGDTEASPEARKAAAVVLLESAAPDRTAQRAAVAYARHAQLPVRRIAEILGVSPSTVSLWSKTTTESEDA